MSVVSSDEILSTSSIKAVLSHKDVENLVLEIYGLRIIHIKDLDGYDDRNFYIEVKDEIDNSNIQQISGNGYVFKVINALDSKDIEFYNAQDSVLVYLSERNLNCPKPIRNKNGDFLTLKTFSSGQHIVRMLEFIPGNILGKIEGTPSIFYNCGSLIANLNLTLKDFTHIGYQNRNTLWMLENIPKLSEFLNAVDDPERQKIVKEVLAAFNSNVLAESYKFEKGLIHGDFNEQNILVEQFNGIWNVKGVLDFGDSHIGCFLYDLAITMTYIILYSQDLDSAGYVLAGYKSVRCLTPQEIQLLKVCICARMCQSLVLGAWTFNRDPTNTYVTRTGQVGWPILRELWSTPDEKILRRWLDICEQFRFDER